VSPSHGYLVKPGPQFGAEVDRAMLIESPVERGDLKQRPRDQSVSGMTFVGGNQQLREPQFRS
jgi:hypothetical protein